MTSQQAVKNVINDLTHAQQASLYEYRNAMYHSWFASQIVSHELLALLRYASEESQVASMHALLYAYAHPGTREGLCQLCLGLFGSDSLVIVEEAPAQVYLKIAISNAGFFFTVLGQDASGEVMSVVAGDFTVVAFSLQALSNDPIYFLRQFVPVGVILTGLELTIQDQNPSPKIEYLAVLAGDGAGGYYTVSASEYSVVAPILYDK